MIIHAYKDGKLAYTGIWYLAAKRFAMDDSVRDALIIYQKVILSEYVLTYSWEKRHD